MSVRVLGISGSPRQGGNTDHLLRECLRGATSVGAACEHLPLKGLTIAPCVECNACYRTGICWQKDDYHAVLDKLMDADRLVFATPIFFMAVSSQAKLLIDRCQCLWSRKYVLKQPMFTEARPDRHALVIAVGGSRSQKMFDSIKLTMKYYLDVLDFRYAGNLLFNRLDEKGAVAGRPGALAMAFQTGARLAQLGDDPAGALEPHITDDDRSRRPAEAAPGDTSTDPGVRRQPHGPHT